MKRWLIIWCVFAVGLVGSVGDSSANSVATEQSDDIICFTATFESAGVSCPISASSQQKVWKQQADGQAQRYWKGNGFDELRQSCKHH